MRHAVRKQTDGKGDEYSKRTGMDFTQERLITRQELASETDTRNILQRYGVPLNTNRPTYGEADYNLDLHTAINSIRETRGAYDRLPEHLRAKYPTMQSILEAVERGELTTMAEPEEKQHDGEQSTSEAANQ